MVKLPKNHPTIIELREQVEYAQKQAKEEAKKHREFLATHLRTALEKKFAKTDIKLNGKVERLIKELEVIASQKQKYA